MKLEWHAKLNTEMVPAKNFRRTSIICTIGMSELLNLILRIFALLRIVWHRKILTSAISAGPKTNSVEKINALRKGTSGEYLLRLSPPSV
jgi:pyruvate kinase